MGKTPARTNEQTSKQLKIRKHTAFASKSSFIATSNHRTTRNLNETVKHSKRSDRHQLFLLFLIRFFASKQSLRKSAFLCSHFGSSRQSRIGRRPTLIRGMISPRVIFLL